MKKVNFMITMFAIMFAALSFTACGSDNGDDATGGDSSEGYIEVKFNGKTYREAINNWEYAQIDPVGKDDQDRKLTFTYDMQSHFENKGFSFMFGIVHFRNRSELLKSASGSYPCAKDILDDSFYNNLTFCPMFDLNGDEYDFERGTHQVKRISGAENAVYVEGSFTASFKLNSDRQTVSGSYKIRIPD